MAKIINGREMALAIASRLKKKVSRRKDVPSLDIVLIGHLSASEIYVNKKVDFGKEVGIKVNVHQLEPRVSLAKVKSLIGRLNAKKNNGIIIQLPLPKKFSAYEIVNLVKAEKDMDGLTAINQNRVFWHEVGILPAAARAVVHLLELAKVSWRGKKVALVGFSPLLGVPLLGWLIQKGATVNVTHRQTWHLDRETNRADVVITATGIPRLIKAKHVKKSAVIIDIGISKYRGHISGDVDYDKVLPKAKFITPVPGGVGPLTVAFLFDNLLHTKIKKIIKN